MSSEPYRGQDRRASPDWREPSLGPFIGVALALLLVIGLFLAGPSVWGAVDLLDVALLRVQLDAATVAVAVLAGALCVVRWRVVGDAPALWVGAALLFFGLVTIGVGSLLPEAQPAVAGHDLHDWAHPASRIAVLWLFYQALRTTPVDSRLRLWPVLLAASGITAALIVAFQLLPGLPRALASAGDAVTATAGGLPVGTIVLVVALVGFGIAFGFRGVRTRRWLFAWFGLMFFALGFAELLRLADQAAGSLWLTGPNVLRFLGILCAVVGATRELVRAFQQQQVHLLETVQSDQAKEARLAAEQRALEELAHEARNALTSIEGATRTLERYRDRLDEETRDGLSDAVTQEIARLQALVSPERVRSTAGEFRVVDVVTAVATAARSHDVTVHVDVPAHLTAHGQPAETGQVVQNLVENARRYAPGSPIHVRAEGAPSGVTLRVEDEGPGVPPEERQAIFERGRRGTAAAATDGTGLGLYVSAQLMRDQGGDLWVDDRAGGGASFALWLPADEASAKLLQQVGDDVEHAVQRSRLASLLGLRAPEDAEAGRPGLADDDDDVGGDRGR